MKKWIAIGGAVVMGMIVSGLVAQPAERGQPWENPFTRHRHRGTGLGLLALVDNDRLRAYLNLTDPQVARLHLIAVESEKLTMRSRTDVGVREIELRELLRADQPDREAILRKVDELAVLRGDLMRQRVEALLSARSVLSSEQQKKFWTFLENREGGGRRAERSGGSHRGWGPPSGMPGGGPAAPPQIAPAQRAPGWPAGLRTFERASARPAAPGSALRQSEWSK